MNIKHLGAALALCAPGLASAASTSTTLYCVGASTRTDGQSTAPADAVFTARSGALSLAIRGLGHGKYRGTLPRSNEFELSVPLQWEQADAQPHSVVVVLQRYTGEIKLWRSDADASSGRPIYQGKCESKPPLISAADTDES